LGPLRGRGQGLGWGRGGKGGGEGEGEVERREMDGPQVTAEPGPLRALLRHWLCAMINFETRAQFTD